ncbi:MAG: phosphatase PAP2 family protein [Rhodospirillaceae bacterium]|nr:phosphatase PAP2 family protein [Rhodospirillaceae bacterium]
MNIDPRYVTDESGAAKVDHPSKAGIPGWLPLREIAITLAMTTLVCAGFVMWLDIPIARAFDRWSTLPITDIFRLFTRAGHSAWWYTPAVIGVALSLWIARASANGALWRRRARALVFVIVSMASSAALVNALKVAFGRYRPRLLFSDDLYGFAPFAINIKHAGFPSGHTQSIVAAMVAFGFLFPRWRYALWGFAAVVAASRFTTAVHYASDVIAGAVIAILTAWTIKRYFERNGVPVVWSEK